MATLATSIPTIASRGHVYFGNVDAAPFSLANYAFNPSTALSGWTWMGDTSAENMIEFSVDGGDVTYKHTWDRPNVRALREAQSVSAVINSVNTNQELFNLAFSGSTYDSATKSSKVGTSVASVSRALFIVMEDETNVAGMYLPNVDLKGQFPAFSMEDFTEVPINVALLGSPTQTAGASGPLQWQWFEPRPRAAA